MGFFDKFKKEKGLNLNQSLTQAILDSPSLNVEEKTDAAEVSTTEENKTKTEIQSNSIEFDNNAKKIEKINKVDIETNDINKEDLSLVNNIKELATKKAEKHYKSSQSMPIENKDNERKRQAMMAKNLNIPSLDSQDDVINEIKELSTIHTTWRDYCLMMLNSTAEPLRSIWREKISTSVTHWEFGKGSISEGNIAGMEILSVLPSELTERLVDDHFEPENWSKEGRLNGSKRMNVHVGRYTQESASNEANICLKYIVQNWDNIIYEDSTGEELIMDNPLLYRMWDLAQKSGGKCILPDEVCTYILEKPVDDSKYGVWIDVAEDVFENGIPSEKYKEHWKSGKIEGYPLNFNEEGEFFKYWKNQEEKEELSFEEQKKNFLSVCDVILREDVAWMACWKKICICILKNDVTMKYAGFSATLRERKAREDAIAAFSTKQEEKAKAKAEAEALAAKIEKERKEAVNN